MLHENSPVWTIIECYSVLVRTITEYGSGDLLIDVAMFKSGTQIQDLVLYDANAAYAYYTADQMMYADYYPFGMQMPGRQSNPGEYDYGFNGMRKDAEVSGEGNSYTTMFRQYDPRLGRWKSIDPLMAMFPHQSPYAAFDNNPIFFTDPLGLAAEGGPDGGGNDGGGGDENIDAAWHNHLAEFKFTVKNSGPDATGPPQIDIQFIPNDILNSIGLGGFINAHVEAGEEVANFVLRYSYTVYVDNLPSAPADGENSPHSGLDRTTMGDAYYPPKNNNAAELSDDAMDELIEALNSFLNSDDYYRNGNTKSNEKTDRPPSDGNNDENQDASKTPVTKSIYSNQDPFCWSCHGEPMGDKKPVVDKEKDSDVKAKNKYNQMVELGAVIQFEYQEPGASHKTIWTKTGDSTTEVTHTSTDADYDFLWGKDSINDLNKLKYHVYKGDTSAKSINLNTLKSYRNSRK